MTGQERGRSGSRGEAALGTGAGRARSDPVGGRRAGAARSGPAAPDPAELTPDADPESVARAVALRQLTLAPRTRAQLAAAMARRAVPADVAEAVLDRFEEVRLVDDGEFARQWVETRHGGRGLSRRALAYELHQRGIIDGTVREAVSVIDDEAEVVAARELVRRRLPGTAADDAARRIRRLAGLLARKGYTAAVAMRAIREELREPFPAAVSELADALDDTGDDTGEG